MLFVSSHLIIAKQVILETTHSKNYFELFLETKIVLMMN